MQMSWIVFLNIKLKDSVQALIWNRLCQSMFPSFMDFCPQKRSFTDYLNELICILEY